MRRSGAVLLAGLCCSLLAACSMSSVRSSAESPVPRSDQPVAVFLGDSYTAGYGDDDGSGYAPTTARELGWSAVTEAEAGTGYVSPGSVPEFRPFGDRLDDVVAWAPDVVVVQGSTNDVGWPAGVVGEAAAILYRRLVDALPDARIVVVGPVAAPGVDALGVRNVRNELHQATTAAGLAFVDPIAERWLWRSDGHFADPVHPNDAGYEQMAADLVAALHRFGW